MQKKSEFASFSAIFLQKCVRRFCDFLDFEMFRFLPAKHTFWSMLKQKVYANNWSAENWDQLIRKIRKCAKEFDMDPIIKMFDHLKAKIKKADQHGLRSLTK